MKPKVLSVALVHFVDFYVYGGKRQSDEVRPQPIKSRGLRGLQIPADAFAFVFFDILEVVVQIGRRRFSLQERINESPEYHVGRCYTLKEILQQFPKEKKLIRRMINFEERRAVRSLHGWWSPLEDDDVVIPHPLDISSPTGSTR